MRSYGVFALILFTLHAPVFGAADECTITIKKKPVPLHRPLGSFERLDEVWEVIGATALGRRIREQAVPLIEKKAWKIEALTAEAKKRNPLKDPAAQTIVSTDATTMYINIDAPLGVLAVHVLHEAIHGLDNEWRDSIKEVQRQRELFLEDSKSLFAAAAKRAEVDEADLAPSHFNAEETKQIEKMLIPYTRVKYSALFKAERKAYDAQAEFIDEFVKLGDCVGPFLKKASEEGELVFEKPSDWQIRLGYGIAE